VSGDQGSEVQEWLDRQAILDLIHRYSDSITRGDYERTAAVFAPDAVWEEPQAGLRFETAGEFIEFLAAGTTSTEVLIQTPHSPVVELVGAGKAKATTTIHEFGRGVVTAEYMFGGVGTELNFDRYGIYYDQLAKFDGEWKFTHRIWSAFFTSTDCVVGGISGDRPLLRPS